MSELENEFVSVVQYPSTAAVATTLGYQVISLVGSQVRKAIDSTLGRSSDSQPPNSNNNNNNNSTSSSNSSNTSKERRFHRRPGTTTSDTVKDDLPIFTLQEVSYHDASYDCWMVIYDRVYDVTTFLNEHPGGDEIMLEYAGRDATLAFRSVGHSNLAETLLKPHLIGILTEKERIWTRFFNMNADFPA